MTHKDAIDLAENLRARGIQAEVHLSQGIGQRPSMWVVEVTAPDGSKSYADSPETAYTLAGLTVRLDHDHKPL